MQITNVDVKVSSKTLLNLSDGETISDSTRPERIVEFRVELRNNFSRQLDFRIEDITVKTTIEGIDNGEDLEIESDRFDLKADTSKRTFFTFQIPLEVREDTYNVVITADGTDEDGTSETAERRLRLEVDKDNHLLRIVKDTLIPTEVACNRKNAQIAVTLLNIGNLDEDAVSLRIYNEDLNLNIEDRIGTLYARPNEPESRYSNTYLFNVPNKLESGNYPINVKVLYNDDRQTVQDTVTLIVNNCATPSTTPPKAPESPGQDSGVVVITPVTEKPAQPQVPSGTVVTQESPVLSNAFVVGIVLAVALLVIVGIVLAVVLFRRR